MLEKETNDEAKNEVAALAAWKALPQTRTDYTVVFTLMNANNLVVEASVFECGTPVTVTHMGRQPTPFK